MVHCKRTWNIGLHPFSNELNGGKCFFKLPGPLLCRGLQALVYSNEMLGFTHSATTKYIEGAHTLGQTAELHWGRNAREYLYQGHIHLLWDVQELQLSSYEMARARVSMVLEGRSIASSGTELRFLSKQIVGLHIALDDLMHDSYPIENENRRES